MRVLIDDNETLLQWIEKVLVEVDEPVIEASNLSIYVMALAAKESGVRVILTGTAPMNCMGVIPGIGLDCALGVLNRCLF